MTVHRRDVFDPAAARAKGGGLVESQVVHRDHFRRGTQRDAVPPQQPRDLQIPRRRQQADEDEIGWFKHYVYYKLNGRGVPRPDTPYCFVPQSPQNFAPASSFTPQFLQNFSVASGLPHSGQNFPPLTLAPQCGQAAMMVCLNLSAET